MQRSALKKLVLASLFACVASVQAQQFTLQPITGQNFRYKDVLSQDYGSTYINGFNYSNSSVVVTLDAPGKRYLSGRIVASGLKPNFAYQIKLEGVPTTVNPDGDNATNERLGYIGRWWRLSPPPEWNATDSEYNTNKDTAGYVYNGYLLMDFFVTDENGSADYTFKGDNSFHVLWRTNQRPRQPNDGPARTVNLAATTAPAYDVSLAARSTDIYAEYEPTRALPGTLQMPTGHYKCNFGLTEESFHESGTNAGFWAWAFKTLIDFDIKSTPAVTWADPADIDSGTALSATQLNATASVNGTFAYDPPLNTILPAGTHTLEVTFTPEDSDNHISVIKTVTLKVTGKLEQTLSITATPDKTYGDAAFSVSASSDSGLTVTLAVTSGPAVLDAGMLTMTGAGTVVLTATQAGDSQYEAATLEQSFEVAKAPLLITADNKTRPAGTPNVLTATYAGFVNGDSFNGLDAPAVLSTTALENSPAGDYLITVSGAADANYQISFAPGTLTITNTAPEFSSGIVATPNPGVAGKPVQFTAAASDADGHEVSFIWTFSDGGSATGTVASHTFTSGGIFYVQVTATDAFGGSSIAQLTMTIINTDTDGDGIADIFDSDSDNDGFSNSIEQLFGTNPFDANDKPAPGPAGPQPEQFTVTKMSLSLNFAKAGLDSISLSGVLPASAGTNVNQAAGLDVGGISRLFVLDSRGRGTLGSDSFKAKLQRNRKQNSSFIKFQAKLKRGRFRASLADENFSGDRDMKKQTRKVVVVLIFDSKAYRAEPALSYSSSAGKNGRASLAKTSP